MKQFSKHLLWTALSFGLVGSVAATAPASAQSQNSLKDSANLQNALRRIARNSNDSSALADAGLAALALGDTRAAIGFLAKADQIYPRSGRVKAGLGRALLAEENPFGAIRYFDQAIENGISLREVAADRGLAYDLIGRNRDAQKDYEFALKYDQSDAVLSRYAISLGISGDLEAADVRLGPLLQKSDRDAWRNRAFILAMNGKKKDANDIARQTMRSNMAKAIKPFFDRMPKLTAAQKAAAVHLGHFPASENIGVDVASVRYAAQNSVRGGSGADAGLIPLGEPLGEDVKKPRVLAMPDTSPRRRPGADRAARRSNRQLARVRNNGRMPLGINRLPAPTSARPVVKPVVARPDQSAAPAVSTASKVNSGAKEENGILDTAQAAPLPAKKPAKRAPEKVVLAKAEKTPSASAGAIQRDTALTPGFETPLGVRNETKSAETVAAASKPVTVISKTADGPGASEPLVSQTVRRQVAIGNAPAVAAVTESRSEGLRGDLDSTSEKPNQAANAPVNLASFDLGKTVPAPPAAQIAQAEPVRRPLSEIIGSINIPDEEKKPAVVPVDLKSITPAKPQPKVIEKKKEPEPEPKKAEPDHPKRYWVQIATGSNMSALKYDFRQMKKKHSKLFGDLAGWTSPWGQTRRMVIGPFDDLSGAKKFDAEFRKNGGDSFAWVSKTGTEVNKLTK